MTTDASSSDVRVGATIDGFRCFAPEIAMQGAAYPEHGFDITRALEEASFWCRARRRLAQSLFKRALGGKASARALEIGCGTGFILEALRRLPNLELTGSEVSIPALRYTRARVPDVELVQLDATANPFHERFDVVAAFDVIEHIPDDAAAVAGAWRALKPGGAFICSVPQYAWMWSGLDDLVCHCRRYSRQSLRERLEGAGFRVEFCTSFVTALFPLMLGARLLAKLRPPKGDDARLLQQEVSFSAAVNRVFDAVMRTDEALIGLGVTLPFGGSLFAIARKPVEGHGPCPLTSSPNVCR